MNGCYIHIRNNDFLWELFILIWWGAAGIRRRGGTQSQVLFLYLYRDIGTVFDFTLELKLDFGKSENKIDKSDGNGVNVARDIIKAF